MKKEAEVYEKGDVISTIPCGLVIVKSRKKDEKSWFYVVRTKTNCKFYIPEGNLITRKATKRETKQFKLDQKNNELK